MFRFYPTNRTNPAGSASSAAAPTTQNTSPIPSTDTWVYVWRMTSDSVGHVAIQVGGDKPKRAQTDSGEYVSIHPKNIPAVGLTSIIPLPATLATNLAEDKDTLSAPKSSLPEPFTPRISVPHPMERPPSPDQTFQLKGLNTDAMNRYINNLQQNVSNGGAHYQLFPRVNLVRFFSDCATFASQDPIDAAITTLMRRKAQPQQVFNCTSLVTTILAEGGLPLKKSRTPWGKTPDALADEIEKRLIP